MVELRDRDRLALTAGVTRIVKASSVVASAALKGRWDVLAAGVGDAPWREEVAWDGNRTLDGVRGVLQRTILAANEQGRGLAQLARSSTGYTVALATLTRGAVEALARVNWLVSSTSANELLVRHASLEFADLRYPAQHGDGVRQRVGEREAWTPVAEYREGIEEFVARYGLAIAKVGLTELATALLSEIYNEAPQLYSGLSAAAHGQGWATGNFFDLAAGTLRRDDQMVIEYCAYVIESTTHVTNKVMASLAPDRASSERWISERDQVDIMLGVILKRRDQPRPAFDGFAPVGEE